MQKYRIVRCCLARPSSILLLIILYPIAGRNSSCTPQNAYGYIEFVLILPDLMKTYQNINVYLIGHSYGGAVVLALDADMKINGQISTNGAIVKGIIALDSPLGGVYGGPLGAYYQVASAYYKKHCQVATGTLYSLNELTQIFLGGPLYGSNNSLGSPPH